MKKLLFFLLFVLVITWTGTAPAHNNPQPSACDSETGTARQVCREYCQECAGSQHHSARKTGGGGGGHHDDDDDDHNGGGGNHDDDDDDHGGGGNCDDDDDDHHSSRKTGGGGGHHGDDDDDDHHGDHDDDDDDGDCNNNNSECDALRRRFERLTGRQLVCEVPPPAPTCATCIAALPLFAQILNAGGEIDECFADATVISVITPGGTFALVNNAVQPPFCSVEPLQVTISAAEATACRNALIQAAANQGIACGVE